MSIPLAEWLAVMREDYLESYVPSGGAAVKFVVPIDNEVAVEERLAAAAREAGLLVATVDAAVTRVDRIQDLFFAVSKQVDWHQIATNVRERAVMESEYTPPADQPLTFDAIAAANGDIAVPFVRRAMEEWFSERVFRDYQMSREFRAAMSRLCFDPMVSGAGEQSLLLDNIIAWLQGELRLVSGVRSAAIYQKVARHNARDLLLSLSHWLRFAGYQGLAVVVDIRATATKTRALAGDANYYSKAALYDLYEVIRQFIDATDEMDGLFLVFVAPPDALEDDLRGLYIYRALQMRIADEVRDRRRDNPLASLVRLDARGEPAPVGAP